jgi:hypothetical protein
MNALLNATAHVNGDQPTINGRGLPHLKLTDDEMVRLAADMATGTRPFRPSLVQTNVLTGVSVAAIRQEIKARAAHNGNGKPPKDRVAAIVEAWDLASEFEREVAVHALGVRVVWDVISRIVA